MVTLLPKIVLLAKYVAVFNDVGYDEAAMSDLLNDLINDISGICVCSVSC